MIEKIVVLVLVVVSLLALGNATRVYQRSHYLESSDRVNLSRLTDHIEQLDRDRLLRLSTQLVTISKSDHGVLILLNREFRRAILWLGASLVSLLLYLLLMQVRVLLRAREQFADSK